MLQRDLLSSGEKLRAFAPITEQQAIPADILYKQRLGKIIERAMLDFAFIA